MTIPKPWQVLPVLLSLALENTETSSNPSQNRRQSFDQGISPHTISTTIILTPSLPPFRAWPNAVREQVETRQLSHRLKHKPVAEFPDLGLIVKYGRSGVLIEGHTMKMIKERFQDYILVPEVYGWGVMETRPCSIRRELKVRRYKTNGP